MIVVYFRKVFTLWTHKREVYVGKWNGFFKGENLLQAYTGIDKNVVDSLPMQQTNTVAANGCAAPSSFPPPIQTQVNGFLFIFIILFSHI